MSQPTGYDRSTATDRPLTVDDVGHQDRDHGWPCAGRGRAHGAQRPVVAGATGLLVGLVISLIVIFKQSSNPALIITYSIAEGIALGAITGALETYGSGNAGQLGGLAGIAPGGDRHFACSSACWSSTRPARSRSPRLTKMIIGAMFGVIGLMLINFVVSFFTTGGIGIRSGGPLAIIFSIVVIGIAAFTLLLDFDMADKAIRAGAPARFSWYIAFGHDDHAGLAVPGNLRLLTTCDKTRQRRAAVLPPRGHDHRDPSPLETPRHLPLRKVPAVSVDQGRPS